MVETTYRTRSTQKPQGTCLGLSMHRPLPREDDDEPRGHPSSPNSVIEQPLECLTTLLSQLESAVELSSSLQAQHTAVQSTISALESRVMCLETLVRTSQALEQVRDTDCRTTIYRADSPRLRYSRPRTFILINTFLPTSLLSLAARIAHADVN